MNGLQRRALLQGGTLVLLLGRHHIARGAGILAVRVWPAPDYTRVTIESDAALPAKQVLVPSPPRLAIDIEGIELNPALRELVAKVKSDDPYISGVRVGQPTPGVVRLVLDLRQEVAPQVFNLPPVAAYQHRLVVDLHPSKPVDPLEALIAQRLKDQAAAGPAPAPAPAPAQAAGAASRDPLGELIAQREPSGKPASVAVAATTGGVLKGTPRAGDLKAPPVAGSRDPQAGPGALASGGATPLATAAERGRPAATTTAPELVIKTDRLIVVALDPGHGGEDPGAIGPNGTREKDVVLRIALMLRDRINASTVGGNPMRAFLTRDADFFVPLQVRVQKARRVQADLFVSIHADAFVEPHARGASVFALSHSGASSAAARWLANKENSADLVGGLNVKAADAQVARAMLDMSTTAQINDSIKLAGALLGEVGRVGKLHKPRVEQAGFAVLKAPDIPSVLVETAFISNPEEEAKLRSDAYQEQLADALMRGIERYFARNPPLARNRVV